MECQRNMTVKHRMKFHTQKIDSKPFTLTLTDRSIAISNLFKVALHLYVPLCDISADVTS